MNFLWIVVCNIHDLEVIRTFYMRIVNVFTLLLPLHYLLVFLYFSRTRKPIRVLLCREIFLIDLLLIFSTLYIIYDSLPIDKNAKNLDHTTIENYFNFSIQIRDSSIVETYTFILILVWLRFFFHLKATKIFGPFIKILTINCQLLIIWLIVYILAIITATNFLIIILSQKETTETGCANFTQCLYLLLEGSVGEVDFDAMLSLFSA